jgi:hypothetical protein
MEGLIILFVIVAGLALLDALAIEFGVDSRDGSTDPRQPFGLTA